MLVMLGCEGFQPERWIGYAQYITQNAGSNDSVAAMTQWPNPESVLQAVAKPELEPWRQSILQAKSPPLPKSAWLLGQTAPQYSPLLAECQDAPSFLFGLGDPSCFDCPAIAIVGSRRPSLDGLQLAEAKPTVWNFAAEGRVAVPGGSVEGEVGPALPRGATIPAP
mgnify:CR=1 FL=1